VICLTTRYCLKEGTLQVFTSYPLISSQFICFFSDFFYMLLFLSRLLRIFFQLLYVLGLIFLFFFLVVFFLPYLCSILIVLFLPFLSCIHFSFYYCLSPFLCVLYLFPSSNRGMGRRSVDIDGKLRGQTSSL
jgi:hypothetical protein